MLLSGTFAFPSSWNATNCVGDELTVALRIAKGKWERMNNFLHGSRPAEITQLWHPPEDPKMGVRWIHKGGRMPGLHKMPHRAAGQSHPRICTGYTGGITLGCARSLVAMGHRQARAAC